VSKRYNWIPWSMGDYS